jgi:hypothetical protein
MHHIPPMVHFVQCASTWMVVRVEPIFKSCNDNREEQPCGRTSCISFVAILVDGEGVCKEEMMTLV